MKRLLLVLLFAGSISLFAAPEPQENRAADAGEHPAKAEEEYLGWKWANFLLLAGILGYLGVKMGGPYFSARAAEIRQGLDEADRAKREADARVAEVNAKLANLNREIEQLKAALHAEQERHVERLRQESAADLARIQAHGEQQIEALSKTARHDLKAYSAELAVQLAEQKIRARLTPDVEERLSAAFFENLKA